MNDNNNLNNGGMFFNGNNENINSNPVNNNPINNINQEFQSATPQFNMNTEVQPAAPQFNMNTEVQPATPQFNMNTEVQPAAPQFNMNTDVQPAAPQFNMNAEVQPATSQINMNTDVQQIQETEVQNFNTQQNAWSTMQNMPSQTTNQTVPMSSNPAQQNVWGGMQMNYQPNQGNIYDNYNSYDQNQNAVPQQPKKSIKLPLIIGGAIGVIAIIILVLFLTGILGAKKLTCSMEDDSFGRTTKQEVIIKFKGERPNQITLRMTMANLTAEEVDSVKLGFSIQLDEYKKEGYKGDVKTTESSATLSITADDLELLGEDAVTSTYGDLKANLEEDGYTCK